MLCACIHVMHTRNTYVASASFLAQHTHTHTQQYSSLIALLIYNLISGSNTQFKQSARRHQHTTSGTQFTGFTGTKEQNLTQNAAQPAALPPQPLLHHFCSPPPQIPSLLALALPGRHAPAPPSMACTNHTKQNKHVPFLTANFVGYCFTALLQLGRAYTCQRLHQSVCVHEHTHRTCFIFPTTLLLYCLLLYCNK
jgi:hypothetical protein